jgi:hypothetical protein
MNMKGLICACPSFSVALSPSTRLEYKVFIHKGTVNKKRIRIRTFISDQVHRIIVMTY